MNETLNVESLHELPVIGRGSVTNLGTLLVRDGLLLPEQVEAVARLQNQQGLRFGEAAVHMGLISAEQLMQVLSRQFDYTYLPAGHPSLSPEVVAAFEPFSPVVEQLRLLRSQLLVRWFSEKSRHGTLALLSAGRGEGRSFMAANLAVLFAQLGERTLLIDADLRNPSQHELFRLEDRTGLASVLAEHCALKDALEVETDMPNLCILPAGPLPPNPLELLSRSLFVEMLRSLRKHFDVILIDTPAADGLADAGVVALRAGSALVVARRDQTEAASLAQLCENLRLSQVGIAGCVLNG